MCVELEHSVNIRTGCDGSVVAVMCERGVTANPPTNIVDFRGLDSSTILMLRGGIPRPKGNFRENLNQAMLGCNVSREIGRCRSHEWMCGYSEGGMILLEALIELKFPNLSRSSLPSYLKLDKPLSVEQFEATISQSTVPSPPLRRVSFELRRCLWRVVRMCVLNSDATWTSTILTML